MKRRVWTIAILFTWMLMLAAGRILWISAHHAERVSAGQGSLSLTLPHERGTIYDRNGLPITNSNTVSLAALTATPEVVTELYRTLDSQAAQRTVERLQSGKPLLMEVPDDFSAAGAFVVRHAERYPSPPLAVHLIGYLDSSGEGVCGIQAAYERQLQRKGDARIRFASDARGGVLLGVEPTLSTTVEPSQGSVTLTLDRRIQQAVQEAVSGLLESGAVIVMDPKTSDILASVSLPGYSPDKVGSALSADGSPLLNRALSAYNTGSVFKLCVVAAALEAGIDPSSIYTCTGEIDCSGQVFHCHKADGHGALNLSQALSESCNTYFIHLASMVGAEKIYDMAQSMGIGDSTRLCPSIQSAEGVLPNLGELMAAPAALANFSLGQGSLLTTPLQIAVMTSAIVNDGKMTPAQLVSSVTDVNGETAAEPRKESVQAMQPSTAATLREMMVSVVANGTGSAAAPLQGGAGGKTATAQTGLRGSDGSKTTQAWFTGFYPAENPQYVITVLAEGGDSGSRAAAPVFAAAANAIQMLGIS